MEASPVKYLSLLNKNNLYHNISSPVDICLFSALDSSFSGTGATRQEQWATHPQILSQDLGRGRRRSPLCMFFFMVMEENQTTQLQVVTVF